MIGTKIYQKKTTVFFFLAAYGILTAIGISILAVGLSRGQNASGTAGFMTIFGAGMFIRTWLKSKKPFILILDEQIELNQLNKPEYIRYKNISNVDRPDDKRLVLSVRDGHQIKKVTIWLKNLEHSDAVALTDFVVKKRWK